MKKKIALIGDLIVDKYKYFKAIRLSPEGPAPIVNKLNSKTIAGGAGNVAISISNLFDEIDFYFSYSKKQENLSKELINSLFNESSVNLNYIETEKKLIIPIKTRYYVDNQNFMREDNEERFAYGYSSIDRELIFKIANDYEIIILSDYQKGFISSSNIQFLINLCNQFSKPLFIDTKIKNFKYLRNAFCLKINLSEFNILFEKYLITDKDNIEDIKNKVNSARIESNIDNLVVTLGAKGSVASIPTENYFAEALSVEIVDITGAGDAFISALVYSFCNQKIKSKKFNSISLKDLKYANRAAGFVVSHKGTVPIPKEFNDKSRKNKYKLGFTNGCFDLLHIGHLSLLKQAKDNCDYLVVGLNSDDSVRKLKGIDRPINNQEKRKAMLLALKFVDEVMIFDEETPLNLIKRLSPNVLIKGEDYELNQIVGKDFVLSNGGKVIRVKLISDVSTSKIINSIQNNNSD